MEEAGDGRPHHHGQCNHRRAAPLQPPPRPRHRSPRPPRHQPEGRGSDEDRPRQPRRRLRGAAAANADARATLRQRERAGRSPVTRWFEELVIDEVFPLGSHLFSEAEIIRFAQLYDPQYFHTDPEAAKLGPFGGLVASGWHTVSVGHRKMVDALFAEADRLRAPGAEPGVPGPA